MNYEEWKLEPANSFTLLVVPIRLKTASIAPSSSRCEKTFLPRMERAQLARSRCFSSKSDFSKPTFLLHSCRSSCFISSFVIWLCLYFLSKSLPVEIHSSSGGSLLRRSPWGQAAGWSLSSFSNNRKGPTQTNNLSGVSSTSLFLRKRSTPPFFTCYWTLL